jgi:hypothetical protein
MEVRGGELSGVGPSAARHAGSEAQRTEGGGGPHDGATHDGASPNLWKSSGSPDLRP